MKFCSEVQNGMIYIFFFFFLLSPFQIFFHYSEFNGNINEMALGDDVEFEVGHRHVSHS